MTDDLHDYAPRPVPADCPWRIASARFAGGDETPRFEVDLVRDDGVRIVVSNAGEGGCHRYAPTLAGGWASIRAFERCAAEWGQAVGVRFEAEDALVYELIDLWLQQQPIFREAR